MLFFWTENSGNFGRMDRAHGDIPLNNKFAFQFYQLTLILSWTTHLLPWVPEVFSRVRRGAFAGCRPQADTPSAENERRSLQKKLSGHL